MSQPPIKDRPAVTGRQRDLVIFLQRSILFLSKHWFVMASLLAGVILGLGFLAPALMSAGQPKAGQTVYRFMASQNHQLPQRSYFLFGRAAGFQSFEVEELVAQGADRQNFEAFSGNPEIGYKMALNHRMTAIFVAILIGGFCWGVAGGRPRLSFIWLILLALPLLLDGFSHMISENSGQGFRAENGWAVTLTASMFSPEFYSGSSIGTLNWLLRTVTGIIFGLGLIWFLYTLFSDRFLAIRLQLEPRLRKIDAAK